jgi:hypothetical protein
MYLRILLHVLEFLHVGIEPPSTNIHSRYAKHSDILAVGKLVLNMQ